MNSSMARFEFISDRFFMRIFIQSFVYQTPINNIQDLREKTTCEMLSNKM